MNSVVHINALHKRFGETRALAGLSTSLGQAPLTGLVGPDGAGKTTLLRLLAGLLQADAGSIRITANRDTNNDAQPRIGYMPQRFGLYEDLTVAENLALYADLVTLDPAAREQTFDRLYAFTRLRAFEHRAAGKLSGGMKQKLGLACALIGTPDILLLDEPSVGVDPVSRRELWHMVRRLTGDGMTVIWSTAYLDEAERCDEVLLLDAGRMLYQGTPAQLTSRLERRTFLMQGIDRQRRPILTELLANRRLSDGVIQGSSLRLVLRQHADRPWLQQQAETRSARLIDTPARFEDAFVDLLGGVASAHSPLAQRMPRVESGREIMVECRNLTRRFGTFVATDHIDLSVRRGEVFALLGPNGAGKSTTFRMLCGLLPPSEGSAWVAGHALAGAPAVAKASLGYMAQKFSLYGLLSVRQNLAFFASAYGLRGRLKRQRIDEMIDTFALAPMLEQSPEQLSLGFRQRLALACALMHRPAVLFLDEPTSGVDPMTRREFWSHISGLVAKGVTVLVTTHFMDEAEYCDRVALIQAGRLIELDTPDELKRRVASSDNPEPTLEDAFIELVARDRKALGHAA